MADESAPTAANFLKRPEALRWFGGILVGAGVYAGFWVLTIRLELFVNVRAAQFVLLYFVILGIPVIAYLYLSGVEPGHFLGLAATGASVAFIADAIRTGGSPVIPVVYLFILIILAGGTLLYVLVERPELMRRRSR